MRIEPMAVVSTEPPLAAGTLTFLFTDIEGSTRLWEEDPEGMKRAQEAHDRAVRDSIVHEGGDVFKSVGDGFCAVFGTAAAAVAAATRAQLELRKGRLSARMAIHTGVAEFRDGEFSGIALNRVSRLLSTAHGGQTILSQSARELAYDALPAGVELRDLGYHRLRDLKRPERVWQVEHRDLRRDFPPLRSQEAESHNLPRQLSSFIGRTQEIEAATRLLATARLVTLVGFGGTGKTRLALKLGETLLTTYADGVWLTDFGANEDPELVPQAIGAALSLPDGPARSSADGLARALQGRRMLLICDNCEHLLSGISPLVRRLLELCPDLHILATSREALGVPGEHILQVPPLSAPSGDPGMAWEEAKAHEAVELFVHRAKAVHPGFEGSDANVSSVVAVCHQLDGIPLALELAASRLRSMTVDQLASRLQDRFRLLTGGDRSAQQRHQTLRALIDWSYETLSEPQAAVFRRLSVFRGGWSLESAENVTADGETIDPAAVMDDLHELVDKSLVVFDAGGVPFGRYRFLESVRHYASERLDSAGEAAGVADRHLSEFHRLALESKAKAHGPEESGWHDLLEAEADNLRAAMDWSLKSGPDQQRLGAEMTVALQNFWMIRGPYREAWMRFQAFLDVDGFEKQLQSNLLNGAGVMCHLLQDLEGARRRFEECAALRRDLGDRRGLASALHNLGSGYLREGDLAKARDHTEEALKIRRELDDRAGLAATLGNLGMVAESEGKLGEAEVLQRESLAIRQELGDEAGAALALGNLVSLTLAIGDPVATRRCLEECFRIVRKTADRRVAADALEKAADLLAREAHMSDAAVLLGAATAVRSRSESFLIGAEADHFAELEAKVKSSLSRADWEEAAARGAGMAFDEMIEWARAKLKAGA